MIDFSSSGQKLLLGDELDGDGELEVEIGLYGVADAAYSWINRDKAIELINHLEDVFNLRTDDAY